MVFPEAELEAVELASAAEVSQQTAKLEESVPAEPAAVVAVAPSWPARRDGATTSGRSETGSPSHAHSVTRRRPLKRRWWGTRGSHQLPICREGGNERRRRSWSADGRG